ncbi:phosphatase 2C-like domain-containing protein [Gymnopilus junonius]|uniref:Protein phosphatase n=1 Tax=Gymnopilus junonius TaxID=109634 RepID=A0A9P5NWA7_GYMJU|nr:phosphatase 2C-like domain-containing protein [Gymnopilus junonius]
MSVHTASQSTVRVLAPSTPLLVLRRPYPHTSLSVQVGEDAYFVRDNAMGIADGVGGWAKSASCSSHHPTPSALFSRRLMHFCSAEIGALDSRSDSAPNPAARPPTTQFSFQHHLKPRPPPPQNHYEVFSFSELEDSLHSSLEELSEGFDVLNILERAYDSTVKSHVVPSSSTPLTTGSSTALLAVLDHPPTSSGPLPQSPEAPHKNYAAGSLHQTDILTEPAVSPAHAETATLDGETTAVPYDAVIRIAHLGDCMGMLVRGDKIAWRSDEMWWGYNHPLQLGPPPPNANPANPTAPIPLPVKPHTFTLPVRADDILILASDGLSDNLWDEDVLDEVLKFRQNDSWGFSDSQQGDSHQTQILRRKAFAGMLSEALCSRAKRVSETRPSSSAAQRRRPASPPPRFSVIAEESEGHEVTTDQASSPTISLVTSDQVKQTEDEIEIPFARRAKLASKSFRGGKHDDISVIVAVISPSPSPSPSNNTSTSTSTDKASNGQPASASGIEARL